MPGNMFQVIKDDATFNSDDLEGFVKKFPANTGTSYSIISIIGPQNSGKSTLLNALFGTKFQTLNGHDKWTSTTKGIWMARSEDIEPYTIVMDIEGTDGAQKEGNTTFEKRSALFALLISDVVIININCNSIGLAHGGSRPLLRIIFQEILKLYDAKIPRKPTLMFVIRDSTNPQHDFGSVLHKVMQEIWNSVEKSPAHQETPYDAFFNVQVVALVQYRELSNGEQSLGGRMQQLYIMQNGFFMEGVDNLKQRLRQLLASGEVVRDKVEDPIPIENFPSETKKKWDITNMKFPEMVAYLVDNLKQRLRQLLASGEVVRDKVEDPIPIENFPSETKNKWDITNMEFPEMVAYLEQERHMNEIKKNMRALEIKAEEDRLKKEEKERRKKEIKEQVFAVGAVLATGLATAAAGAALVGDGALGFPVTGTATVVAFVVPVAMNFLQRI